MANYSVLKTFLFNLIKTNGAEEITGAVHQSALDELVDVIGDYECRGVATSATNPGNPDRKVFYFATEVNTYANFSVVVNENEFCIIKGTGTSWTKEVILDLSPFSAGGRILGIATPTTNPGTPSGEVYYFASEVGTYTNFGSTVIEDGQIWLFKYSSAVWSYSLMYDPFSGGATTFGPGRWQSFGWYKDGGPTFILTATYRASYRLKRTDPGYLPVIYKTTNTLRIEIPEGNDLRYFNIECTSSDYPDGYMNLEFAWLFSGTETGYNADWRGYIAPAGLQIILGTGAAPTDGSPYQYTNQFTIDSSIEITSIDDHVIRLKINDIDQYDKFAIVGTF